MALLDGEGRKGLPMAKKINYATAARLTWVDISKLTTGVAYRRGPPYFEGTLAEAVRHYFLLAPSSRPLALLETDPQEGLNGKATLRREEIEALRRRADFPSS